MAASSFKFVLVTVSLVAAGLAGCLGTGADDTKLDVPDLPAVPDFASLIDLDHDHADRALHNLSWNVMTVGWSGERVHADSRYIPPRRA